MKLSMWILADWLKKYQPVLKIQSGEQVLRSARILSTDTLTERQNVYLAPAKEFISGEASKVMCVHGHDILLLDTTDMDSVLNDIFDAFDYYNSWSDRLAEDVENGCELQHLVNESRHVFCEPIAIFDAGHMLIAHSLEYKKGSVDKEWDVLLETGSNSFDILDKMRKHLHNSRFSHDIQELKFPYFSMHSLQRMLFHNHTVIGRIILLEFHQKESKGQRQLLNTFSCLVEKWLIKANEQQFLKSECDVFRDLLDKKTVSSQKLNYKLSMLGWKSEHKKYLIRLELPEQYKDITFPLIAKLERLFPECYVFLHKESIFILANTFFISVDALDRELTNLLIRSRFHCAFSYPFHNVSQLDIPAEQCDLTLQCAHNDTGGIYHCRDYSLDYIHNILHTKVSRSVIHPALFTLMENDRGHHNDLYKTLYCYLTNNCNLAYTARILNLHRNSLLYRLNKIRTLTHLKLDDRSTREYLYLSYIISGKDILS